LLGSREGDRVGFGVVGFIDGERLGLFVGYEMNEFVKEHIM